MTFDFRDFSRVLLLSREHFLICYGHGYLFVKIVTGTSKNYQSMSTLKDKIYQWYERFFKIDTGTSSVARVNYSKILHGNQREVLLYRTVQRGIQLASSGQLWLYKTVAGPIMGKTIILCSTPIN